MEPSIPEQEETPKKPETSLEDLPGVGPATAEKLITNEEKVANKIFVK